MSGNSFGKALVLTTFGESHGIAVGGILDGFPSNIVIIPSFIQAELDRRKPVPGAASTQRSEDDKLDILSGVYNGRSTGAPIAFIVYNHDQKSADYDQMKDLYRPSHADYTWEKKFGNYDPRGGGRASARETVARVAGGAFAKLFLQTRNVKIIAVISQIGEYIVADPGPVISDPEIITFIERIKAEGDTVGGVVSCTVSGMPAGIGEPVFDKLQADLARAMLSISAVKGFEYGSGFGGASMKGSGHNDLFVNEGGAIRTRTNYSGGIQGGISNGEDICFRVAFKPVSTLMRDQTTVDKSGKPAILHGKGRHDVCVVPRALPIVEAMAALVMADHLIRSGVKAEG